MSRCRRRLAKREPTILGYMLDRQRRGGGSSRTSWVNQAQNGIADEDILGSGRPTMADDALQAEVERLRAENEALKARSARSVSIKVSEKGGVSVYGLGRFPVTLYKEQWSKLLAMTDEIRAFLKEHDAELKAKPE